MIILNEPPSGPQHYSYNSKGRTWSKRVQKYQFQLGCMVSIHPRCGEQFYLRLLLKYKKGAKNYKDLRQINNKQCETFEEACTEFGLLQNEDHWIKCMQEAAKYKIAYAL